MFNTFKNITEHVGKFIEIPVHLVCRIIAYKSEAQSVDALQKGPATLGLKISQKPYGSLQ